MLMSKNECMKCNRGMMKVTVGCVQHLFHVHYVRSNDGDAVPALRNA